MRIIRLLFGISLSLAAAAGYCQSADIFTISTSYNNLISNHERTGILDQVLTETFHRLGIPMEIVFTNTDKSLVDVNAGLLDGEMNRIGGMDATYPNLVQVPEPNMTMHFVAFAKEDFVINGWESIRNLYIGMVRGWKILEWNTEGFPNVVTTPTEMELFTMLHKDRLDIALYSMLTGYAALKEYQYPGIHHLEPPLASRDMFLYVHESHRDIIDDIAASLAEIKADGTYDAIYSQVTSSLFGE